MWGEGWVLTPQQWGMRESLLWFTPSKPSLPKVTFKKSRFWLLHLSLFFWESDLDPKGSHELEAKAQGPPEWPMNGSAGRGTSPQQSDLLSQKLCHCPDSALRSCV